MGAPDRGTIGIIFLIITESALFTFLWWRISSTRKEPDRALSKDVLELAGSGGGICLLRSSLTIVFAEHALAHNQLAASKPGGSRTICLGLEFLVSTGLEWRKLIFERPFDPLRLTCFDPLTILWSGCMPAT